MKFIECVFFRCWSEENCRACYARRGRTRLSESKFHVKIHFKSINDGTAKTYYSYITKWKLFCDKNGCEMIPAQPIHIALYLNRIT